MQSAKKRNAPNSDCNLYFEELLMTDKPKVSWKEVIGLEDAKRAMRESIVYPTMRPDLLPLGWARGILLFGPPGCGKTLLAAAAAAEIEGYFINVDAASMMSKWLGEAEKMFQNYLLWHENCMIVRVFRF
jgi:SpoVK/Ycf46/Vps4 family AAA+-type ATPase